MTKGKSIVITVAAAILLFCILYLSSSYDIHWYNVFITIFAYYGIVSSLFTFYNWLRTPSEEPKHRDITVASGKTIPKTWLDPFKVVEEAKKSE